MSYVTPPQLATASFVEVTARADAVYPCVHVSVSGMPGRAVQQRPDSDNAADVDDVLTYSTGMPVVGVALCPFCTCGWQRIAPMVGCCCRCRRVLVLTGRPRSPVTGDMLGLYEVLYLPTHHFTAIAATDCEVIKVARHVRPLYPWAA